MIVREKAALTRLARLVSRVPTQRVLLDKALAGRIERLLPTATEVALETGSFVADALADGLEREGTRALAEYVTEQVPDGALSLRPIRLWGFSRRLTDLPDDPLEDPELGEQRAAFLMLLATEYQEAGDYNAALVVAEEGVAAHWALADYGNGIGVPTALRIVGGILFELGHLPQALTRFEEATKLLNILAEDHPESFLEHLATTQREHAELLEAMGRVEAASDVRRAAITHLRRVQRDFPSQDLIDEADIVRNLGCLLAEDNQLTKAREVLESAVDLHRELTAARPEEFSGVLAESLHHFGSVCLRLGEMTVAVQRLQASLALWQSIVDDGTEGARLELARTKSALASALIGSGDRVAARTVAEAATEDFRRLPSGYRNGVLAGEIGALKEILTTLSE